MVWRRTVVAVEQQRDVDMMTDELDNSERISVVEPLPVPTPLDGKAASGDGLHRPGREQTVEHGDEHDESIGNDQRRINVDRKDTVIGSPRDKRIQFAENVVIMTPSPGKNVVAQWMLGCRMQFRK